MLKTRHIFLVFLPALMVAAFVFFIRAIQYEPLSPKASETAEEPQALQIPIFPDDPMLGDKKAPITLIAFEDAGCAACAEQHAMFQKLLETYPKKIKIIWKPLPVTLIPYPSGRAHEYAYCANQQEKFDVFVTLAFENQNDLSPVALNRLAEQAYLDGNDLTACLDSGEARAYVGTTEQLGRALNIQSVPTIFRDNKQIEHPKTIEGWETLLGL